MTKYLLLLILVGAGLMLVGRWRQQLSWFNVGIVLLSIGVLCLLGLILMVMLSPNM
jgi:hypothetical protein